MIDLYYRLKLPLYEWNDRRHFYRDPVFKTLDQKLRSGPNPYPISHVFPYGETPFSTLYQIAKAIDLKPTDHFFDLGCGRGRGVFFLSHFFGCRATGIDLTSSFITRAKKLAHNKVAFHCQDFLKTELSEATCIYLYGTTYPDSMLHALRDRLPTKGRVITVSAPLQGLSVTKTLTLSYPWGRGEVFIHQV